MTRIDALVDAAARLPEHDVDRLVAALAAPTGFAAVGDLRARATGPALRDSCDAILRLADEVEPQWIAGVLAGAAASARRSAAIQTVEVVWTGPASNVQTGRLTASVIVELIDEARTELLLVSFASYDEPRIGAALHAAVDRGVKVTLLLERHADNPAYQGADQPWPDLDARRWVWPGDKRPYGAALHAKVIVVDSRAALLGSANLTGRAIDHNLECGVLIRGGAQPKAIRDHLWSLRYRGGLA